MIIIDKNYEFFIVVYLVFFFLGNNWNSGSLLGSEYKKKQENLIRY